MKNIIRQFSMAACALALLSPGIMPAQSAEEKPSTGVAASSTKAEEALCMNNLKQIGLAARIHAFDHGDVLPKDFISMKLGLSVPKILICPGDSDRKKYINSSWDEMDAQRISYEMVSPGVSETEPQKIFVRCPIHGLVVLVDGSVQKMRTPPPAAALVAPPPATPFPSAAPSLVANTAGHTAMTPSDIPSTPKASKPAAPTVMLAGSRTANTVAQGLLDEEINNNPEEAARKYQEIVAKFDQQRLEAGKAIFRLAECYRKLGRREEAVLQYSRILREFVDQPDLARASQQQLTPLLGKTVRSRRTSSSTSTSAPIGLPEYEVQYAISTGMAASSALAGSISTSESKARQLELLRAELDLVKAQLEQTRNKVKAGVAPQDETFKLERDILALQRQLAALSAPRDELFDLKLPEKEKMLSTPEPVPAPPVSKTEPVNAARYGTRLANVVEKAEPDYQNDPKYRELMRELESANEELTIKQTKMREAIDKMKNSFWLLSMVTNNNDITNLPKEVENNERYRELKTEYENLIIENAGKENAETQKKIESSLIKLKTWLNKVYLPELKANGEYAKSLADEAVRERYNLEDRVKEYQLKMDKLKQELLEKSKSNATLRKF